MQEKLVNFYQFLYHVTPVVNFQGKNFVDWELVSTLSKNN